MRELIIAFFNKLSMEKGEDIFEYGFGYFETEKFIKFLYKNNHIDEEQFKEFVEDDYELFQVISMIDEEDYDKGLGIFVDYILSVFNKNEIADILICAAE